MYPYLGLWASEQSGSCADRETDGNKSVPEKRDRASSQCSCPRSMSWEGEAKPNRRANEGLSSHLAERLRAPEISEMGACARARGPSIELLNPECVFLSVLACWAILCYTDCSTFCGTKLLRLRGEGDLTWNPDTASPVTGDYCLRRIAPGRAPDMTIQAKQAELTR